MQSLEDLENSLLKLRIFDPQLAQTVITKLTPKKDFVCADMIARLIDETFRGMSQEITFGQAIANGFAELIGAVSPQRLHKYGDLVREAGREGPTVGRILATCLAPIFVLGEDRLIERFLQVLGVLRQKGTYTLKDPLEGLSALLKNSDHETAWVYLEVLGDTFTKALTYGQCQHFGSILPKTILDFVPVKRAWQTKQLHRIIQTDFSLAEPFLIGMARGLDLLSQKALDNFVRRGFEKYHRHRKSGLKFFALESKAGLDACRELQVTVFLFQIEEQLTRYLQARTGFPLTVKKLSALPESSAETLPKGPGVCSDGQFIYLPDEIDVFPTKHDNAKLYKILTRLEAAFYEFHSFDFDGEGFLSQFADKELAVDLFAIFELARLRRVLSVQYPGLVRQSYPVLRDEALRILSEDPETSALDWLYAVLALNLTPNEAIKGRKDFKELIEPVSARFEDRMTAKNMSVDASAEQALATYHDIRTMGALPAAASHFDGTCRPLRTAFNWRPWPKRSFSSHPEYERIAQHLKSRLEAKGLTVSSSDLKKRLLERHGRLGLEDLIEITGRKDLQHEEIEKLLQLSAPRFPEQKLSETDSDRVFWYKEWDHTLSDYLHRHVRVRERSVAAAKNDFYRQTIDRHQALVKRMRYAFELLKPEGLSILRPWIEGDEVDYRALLDFAVDKKSGFMPSDRLYLKRLKQQRDVVVLLLVDLSHSTSSLASGSRASVLDVEKEAIVIFSEALLVVGDTFGIAGFSGSGRLGVDYYWLKNFDEGMDDPVRHRIDVVTPERNTRMGAAIRHAASRLEKLPSKVRLLIILGDGFPNDVNYKQEYAIADTRQALVEARSNNIYVHAITVNIAADPKLDDLYGNVHHNVISDVRELPDRLPWIYGALTKR